MTAGRISVVVEEPAWKKSGVDLARIRAVARLALTRGWKHENPSPSPAKLQDLSQHPSPTRGEGKRANSTERSVAGEGLQRSSLTILLANDGTLRRLNACFRSKDAPTNVLAFPSVDNSDGYLGDVAIALGVAEREATMAGRSLLAHTLHLTVHGVLHLLGYDHVKAREARTMERLEIAILHELGVPSPYARAQAAE